jgi:uncharacterized membrane protein
METLNTFTLILHVISGFLALLAGTSAVISKKGSKWHRRWGKLFFYSMLGVCFTAFWISVIKSNAFLLEIAIFSLYMNYFGFMAIKNKSLKPKPLDFLVLVAALINTYFMLSSGSIVLMVFGGICVYTLSQNIRVIVILRKRELAALSWLKMHIGMMMGAFIATVTAFLVVNIGALPLHQVPGWMVWLFPSFVLLPLSFYYTRKYVTKRRIV